MHIYIYAYIYNIYIRSIIVWSISSPKSISSGVTSTQYGGNIWFPLTKIQHTIDDKSNSNTKFPITSISYDSKGSLLLTCNSDGSIILWELSIPDKTSISSNTAPNTTSASTNKSIYNNANIFMQLLNL